MEVLIDENDLMFLKHFLSVQDTEYHTRVRDEETHRVEGGQTQQLSLMGDGGMTCTQYLSCSFCSEFGQR